MEYKIDGNNFTMSFHPEGVPAKEWPSMSFGDTHDITDAFGVPIKVS